MTVVRCLVCGAGHAACGPATTVIGVDQNIVEASAVGELRQYEVIVNGKATLMNLNDADAERLGGTLVTPAAPPVPDAPAVPGKARTAGAVPNKARTAESK